MRYKLLFRRSMEEDEDHLLARMRANPFLSLAQAARDQLTAEYAERGIHGISLPGGGFSWIDSNFYTLVGFKDAKDPRALKRKLQKAYKNGMPGDFRILEPEKEN